MEHKKFINQRAKKKIIICWRKNNIYTQKDKEALIGTSIVAPRTDSYCRNFKKIIVQLHVVNYNYIQIQMQYLTVAVETIFKLTAVPTTSLKKTTLNKR